MIYDLSSPSRRTSVVQQWNPPPSEFANRMEALNLIIPNFCHKSCDFQKFYLYAFNSKAFKHSLDRFFFFFNKNSVWSDHQNIHWEPFAAHIKLKWWRSQYLSYYITHMYHTSSTQCATFFWEINVLPRVPFMQHSNLSEKFSTPKLTKVNRNGLNMT